jgi:hypothetical protein
MRNNLINPLKIGYDELLCVYDANKISCCRQKVSEAEKIFFSGRQGYALA